MLLTDIEIEHRYIGKKAAHGQEYLLHPFTNRRGEGVDKFEVLADVDFGGVKRKRSFHVNRAELAELYARGLVPQLGLRLRLRSACGSYPDSPPGKKVPSTCIKKGSDFDREIAAVDVATPMSSSLRELLEGMFPNVSLGT